MGLTFQQQHGRGAQWEMKSAALSTDFGIGMFRQKFGARADAILATLGTYSRGPRKGLPRGRLCWQKVIAGGWGLVNPNDEPRFHRFGVIRPGCRAWAVTLDERIVDELDNDHAAAAQEAAASAQRVADWEALPVSQQVTQRALKARAAAHAALKDGDAEGFRAGMARALKLIRSVKWHRDIENS